nr:heme lyase CcmF/NrfE family subunit [Oceanococcus sp. HetDA_MAG_MS8]
MSTPGLAASGHLALAFALVLCATQALTASLGYWRRNAALVHTASQTAYALFAVTAAAFAVLITAFVQNDFSIAYVANHSNTLLPVHYRVAATWGGHEGSLLLWALMLAGWNMAVALTLRQRALDVSAGVLATLGAVGLGFMLFMLGTSNPFERGFPVPTQGRDLNPLLQDPGLIFHPPMLYMGYVGFSVAFAFAVTALVQGRLDAAWIRWVRPWTNAAWVFLTLGIALGSWWAYNELGWGGWWFWDPVENASFMPWLVGTALMHSLAVTEKRGHLVSWTLLLAIAAFSLSLLGTFLVRSGVLVSVHAFASDPSRGVFILAFFAATVGLSLLLFALRGHTVRMAPGPLSLGSKEGLLLLNNLLLTVAAASVLLGTLYPLVVDAMGLPKPSVGPPWFNATFVPLMLPALVLCAAGFFVPWRSGRAAALWRAAAVCIPMALILSLLLMLSARSDIRLSAWLGLACGALTLVAALWAIIQRARRGSGWTRSWLGMTVAHFGLGVFALGVGLVSAADYERDIALAPGETVEMGGYDWSLMQMGPVEGPNYVGDRGVVQVARDGKLIATLSPEKRIYHSQPNNPMTESAVDAGVLRDLYVSLGEPLGANRWSLRVYYKPLMRWVWGGAVLMALGGALAMSDRRYYRQRRTQPTVAREALA